MYRYKHLTGFRVMTAVVLAQLSPGFGSRELHLLYKYWHLQLCQAACKTGWRRKCDVQLQNKIKCSLLQSMLWTEVEWGCLQNKVNVHTWVCFCFVMFRLFYDQIKLNNYELELEVNNFKESEQAKKMELKAWLILGNRKH